MRSPTSPVSYQPLDGAVVHPPPGKRPHITTRSAYTPSSHAGSIISTRSTIASTFSRAVDSLRRTPTRIGNSISRTLRRSPLANSSFIYSPVSSSSSGVFSSIGRRSSSALFCTPRDSLEVLSLRSEEEEEEGMEWDGKTFTLQDLFSDLPERWRKGEYTTPFSFSTALHGEAGYELLAARAMESGSEHGLLRVGTPDDGWWYFYDDTDSKEFYFLGREIQIVVVGVNMGVLSNDWEFRFALGKLPWGEVEERGLCAFREVVEAAEGVCYDGYRKDVEREAKRVLAERGGPGVEGRWWNPDWEEDEEVRGVVVGGYLAQLKSAEGEEYERRVEMIRNWEERLRLGVQYSGTEGEDDESFQFVAPHYGMLDYPYCAGEEEAERAWAEALQHVSVTSGDLSCEGGGGGRDLGAVGDGTKIAEEDGCLN